jgi:hypothetical protein
MVRKQLLTVVCLLGILACGACFLPPLPAPPPRPPRLDLHRSQGIRVEVTNVSATHHVDSGQMSQWLAEAINRQRRPTIPPARAGGEPMAGDAVMQVSIVGESLTPVTTDRETSDAARPEVTLDATLTRPDGAIVWREMNYPYRSNIGILVPAAGDPWSSTGVQGWVQYYLCNRLAGRLLMGRP